MSTFDRNEFLNGVREKLQKARPEVVTQLRAAQAIGPVMERLLTGNDSWDRYLQHLQGLVNQAGAAKARALEKLTRSPEVWAAHDMAKLKCDVIAADTALEVLALAMELPKLLIENADIAAQHIAQFGVKDDKPAS